jgi:hypothetical protein
VYPLIYTAIALDSFPLQRPLSSRSTVCNKFVKSKLASISFPVDIEDIEGSGCSADLFRQEFRSKLSGNGDRVLYR